MHNKKQKSLKHIIKKLVRESWRDKEVDVWQASTKPEDKDGDIFAKFPAKDKAKASLESRLKKVLNIIPDLESRIDDLNSDLQSIENSDLSSNEKTNRIKELKKIINDYTSNLKKLKIESDQLKLKIDRDVDTAFEDIEGTDLPFGKSTVNVPKTRKYTKDSLKRPDSPYSKIQRELEILSPIVNDIVSSKSKDYQQKFYYLYFIRHYMNVYKKLIPNIDSYMPTKIGYTSGEDLEHNRARYYALVDLFSKSNGQKPDFNTLRSLLKSVTKDIRYIVKTDAFSDSYTSAIPVYSGSVSRKTLKVDNKKVIPAIEWVQSIVDSVSSLNSSSYKEDEFDLELDQVDSKSENQSIIDSLKKPTKYDSKIKDEIEKENKEREEEYKSEIAFVNINTPQRFGGTFDDIENDVKHEVPGSLEEVNQKLKETKRYLLICLNMFSQESGKFRFESDRHKSLFIKSFKKSYSFVKSLRKLNEKYEESSIFDKLDKDERSSEEHDLPKRYEEDEIFHPVFVKFNEVLKTIKENIKSDDSNSHTNIYFSIENLVNEDINNILNLWESNIISPIDIKLYGGKKEITTPYKEIMAKYMSVINSGVEVEELITLQKLMENLDRPLKLDELSPYYAGTIDTPSGIKQHLIKNISLDRWLRSNLDELSAIYFKAIKEYGRFLKSFDDDVLDFDNPFSKSQSGYIEDRYGKDILDKRSTSIFEKITLQDVKDYFYDIKDKKQFYDVVTDKESKNPFNVTREKRRILNTFIISDKSVVRKFVSDNLFKYYVENVYNPFYYNIYFNLARWFQKNEQDSEIGQGLTSLSYTSKWSRSNENKERGKDLLGTLSNILSLRTGIKHTFNIFPDMSSYLDIDSKKEAKFVKEFNKAIDKLLSYQTDTSTQRYQELEDIKNNSTAVCNLLLKTVKDKTSTFGSVRKSSISIDAGESEKFYSWLSGNTLSEDSLLYRLADREFKVSEYKKYLNISPKQAEVYLDDALDFFEELRDYENQDVDEEIEILKRIKTEGIGVIDSLESAEGSNDAIDFELTKSLLLNSVERLRKSNLSLEYFNGKQEEYLFYKIMNGKLDIDDFENKQDFDDFAKEIEGFSNSYIVKMSDKVKSNLKLYVTDLIDNFKQALESQDQKTKDQ